MNIIDEYRNITENIAVVKSKLATARRELRKNINIYKPADAKAASYEDERVQTSISQQSLFTTADNIYKLNNQIAELKQELHELYQQRDKLEKVINGLGDTKKQVLMLQIKGYTQVRISKELNYSKVWIEKLCSQIKKEYGKSMV